MKKLGEWYVLFCAFGMFLIVVILACEVGCAARIRTKDIEKIEQQKRNIQNLKVQIWVDSVRHQSNKHSYE